MTLTARAVQIRRLRRQGNGYTIDGEFRAGFPDDPSLTIGQRLRIAGWARALTPEELTDEQRELLDRPAPEASPVSKEAARLAGFEGSPYWKTLTEGEKALVRDPSLHPELRDASYPLDAGQLATLLGVGIEAVVDWRRYGLRPAHVTNGTWEVWQPTVVRAFHMRNMGPASSAASGI